MSAQTRPNAARSAPSRAMPALMSACVVVVVAMVAAINLGLAKLSSSDLHPSSTELLWIVDAYILVFGCLLIPAGALGDRLGRKGVLLTGLGVFAPAACCLLRRRTSRRYWPGGCDRARRRPRDAGHALAALADHTARTNPHAIATWTGATGAAGTLGGGLILQWLPWQGMLLIIGSLALLLALAVIRVVKRCCNWCGRTRRS